VIIPAKAWRHIKIMRGNRYCISEIGCLFCWTTAVQKAEIVLGVENHIKLLVMMEVVSAIIARAKV